MSNGLMLGLNEFRALPAKKKLDCLYENQVQTLKIMKGYKLYYKITAIIGSFLVIGMGVLFRLQLGIR